MFSPELAQIVAASFARAPWGWGVFVMLILGYWRIKPLMGRLANEREANLLKERADEMASMRDEIAELRDELRMATEEIRILRHDLANANQSLDIMLTLIEVDPARAAEQAPKVRAQREAARQTIHQEKQTLMRARVSKIGGKE